jgi:hypothetical protein
MFENRSIRIVKLKDFDFACSKPSKALDIATNLSGDVSRKFIDYSPDSNRNMDTTVTNIYRDLGLEFMKNVSEFAINFLINYPETLKCK